MSVEILPNSAGVRFNPSLDTSLIRPRIQDALANSSIYPLRINSYDELEDNFLFSLELFDNDTEIISSDSTPDNWQGQSIIYSRLMPHEVSSILNELMSLSEFSAPPPLQEGYKLYIEFKRLPLEQHVPYDDFGRHIIGLTLWGSRLNSLTHNTMITLPLHAQQEEERVPISLPPINASFIPSSIAPMVPDQVLEAGSSAIDALNQADWSDYWGHIQESAAYAREIAYEVTTYLGLTENPTILDEDAD